MAFTYHVACAVLSARLLTLVGDCVDDWMCAFLTWDNFYKFWNQINLLLSTLIGFIVFLCIMAESEVMDFANVLAADIPLAVSNLNDIKTIVNQVNQMVRNLIDRVKNKEFPTAQGMSFLDVKNQLLLKYLMDLNCLLLKKVSGESIKASSSIGNLTT